MDLSYQQATNLRRLLLYVHDESVQILIEIAIAQHPELELTPEVMSRIIDALPFNSRYSHQSYEWEQALVKAAPLLRRLVTVLKHVDEIPDELIPDEEVQLLLDEYHRRTQEHADYY